MRDHAAGPTQRAAPTCAVMGCRRRIPAQRLGACMAAAVLGVVLACCASLAQEVVEWPEGSYDTVQEGGPPIPIRIYLTSPIERGFTIQWGATPVTVTGLGTPATEGDDYTPASGELEFPPNTPAEVRFEVGQINIVDDGEEEGLETFEVQLIAVIEVGEEGDRLFIELGEPLRFAIAPSAAVTLPTLSIGNASASEGDAASFTVTLSEASEDEVTVELATAPDATAGANPALAGADYTAVTTPLTLTFAPGETEKTFRVQTLEDELDEPDETFLARLSNPMGATISQAEGTGTIVDDDLPPTLSINDARAVESNAVTFTVTRSGAAGHVVSVQWMTAPDGRPGANAAQAGLDYTAVTTLQTLTFAAGETEKTIPVQSLDDVIYDPDETFLVRLSNPAGATITRDEGTGTIVDDGLPPTLSIDDARAAEGEDVVFRVSRSGAAGSVVSVQWETAPDRRPGANAAQAGLDYTAVTPPRTLVFAAGETEKRAVVRTLEDDLDEPDETFRARLSIPVGATITRGRGVGTIVDDDLPPPPPVDPEPPEETGDPEPPDETGDPETPEETDDPGDVEKVDDGGAVEKVEEEALPPTLSINDAGAPEGEDAVFTVTRSGETDSVVSVQWNTAPDERPGANPADAGADYAPVTMPQTLVFAAGETEKTVVVRTVDDDLHEADETFLARLSNPVGATIVRGTGVGTIADNDLPPTLSINDAGAPEGEDVVFTVTRSGAAGNAVSVQWNTAPDERPGANPADAGADYAPVTPPQTLVFAAGETEKTVAVQTIDDDLHEPDETFLARLSNPVGATILRGTGVGTIADNDLPPTLSINDAAAVEGEDVVFTVTRGGAAGNAVSVPWETAPDGRPGAEAADAGIDYQAVTPPQTLAFAAGETEKTVVVRTIEDDLDEPDETFLARLGDPVGAAIVRGTGVGAIMDDDQPPALSIHDAAPVEEGAAAVFTVTLPAASGRTVTARWNTVPGSATEGEDYVGAAGTVTIPAGETAAAIRVATIDDALVEPPEEAFQVTLSAPARAALGRETATGAILDDDRPEAGARLRRVNEELLPRVGSALMRRHLDRLLACIDHAAPGAAAPGLPGLAATLAGYAAARDAGWDPSWWEALGGARLALSAPGEPSGRRALGLCGSSDWQRMRHDGAVAWEGELAGAHLGGNLRLKRNLLVGVGVSHDRGAFDWRQGSDAASGVWRLRLTGAQPYAAWFAENAARLWAMGSAASGTVEIDDRAGAAARQRADARHVGAAAGGSWPLNAAPDPGGFRARLRIEGWLGRIEIAANGDLVTAVSVATEGVRGLLEGAWHYPLGDGKRLTRSVWAGLQHDDGAGGTGFESGAGLRWEDRARGLSAMLEGRALLVEGAVREWGASADVRLGRRDALGPSLRSSLSWGDAAAATAALWERGALWQTADGPAPPGRLAAEVGYGLRGPGGRGVLTPYSGLTFTDAAARGHRVGLRLRIAAALEVNLEGEWRQAADGTTDRRLALVGTLRPYALPAGRAFEPARR